MKTAAIYTRVSTQDQADFGTSLESQLAACQQYAAANGYKVVAALKEQKSGASLDRPQLDILREMARRGDIEAVIFYALDRLSRDETDALILAREWRSKGVELKCATVALEDTPQGQFLYTMLTAVGKLERAGILERTMRGKRQSVRNGNLMKPSVDLYGYTYEEGHWAEDTTEGKVWIAGRNLINEYEAGWVRQVFEWYVVDGLPLNAIAQRLTERGVPTRKGGYWAPQTVRNIIRNEAYTGHYWWGKEEVIKGKPRRMRPRAEWIGPVSIPPLVSPDMLQAALARIEYNTRNSARRCKAEYLLRGMIFCELCGRRYAGSRTQNRKSATSHSYYVCTNQRAAAAGKARCACPRQIGPAVEEQVWADVLERLSNPGLMLSSLQAEDEQGIAQRRRDDADMRQLVALRSDLEREENKLIELFTADYIDIDKFRERKAGIDKKGEGIEERIREIEDRVSQRAEVQADLRSAQELCEAVRVGLPMLSQDLAYEDKRALMEAMHIKVTARADGTIHVDGNVNEQLLAIVSGSNTLDKEPQQLLPGQLSTFAQTC